jgi:Tol biopolymer transport system component
MAEQQITFKPVILRASGPSFENLPTKESLQQAQQGGGSSPTVKLVVGAYRDDDNGDASGSVYLYDPDGTNEVKITASDGAANDYFGHSVAIGDNKIAVGAFADDDNGGASGSVYVYDLDGTNEVKITASDGAGNDRFGYSVAIGNNKIAVGAYLDDDNGGASGSVYVYDLDGTNEVKITASDAAGNDRFGYSVAIGNNKIAVGAYLDDDNGGASGSVYVYDLDGTNEVKITASDGAANDYFGHSVAVGDNKIVVGAYEDDDNGGASGSVYVYDLDGTNEVKITASDGAADDNFGYSVAVGDNKIVVGARFDDDNGINTGSVYVYDLDGTNEVKITASDGTQEALFGQSVAVGNNKIVVGARSDQNNGIVTGSVYVYDLDGTNEVKITASDAASGDNFGWAVAIN